MSINKKLGKHILRQLANYSDDNITEVDKIDSQLLSVSFQELMKRAILDANELAKADNLSEIFPVHIETALRSLIEK